MKRMTLIICTILMSVGLIACSSTGSARSKPASQTVVPPASQPKPTAIDTDRKRLIVARRAIDELIVLERVLNSKQVIIAGITHRLPDDLIAQLQQRLSDLRDDCITLMGGVGRQNQF